MSRNSVRTIIACNRTLLATAAASALALTSTAHGANWVGGTGVWSDVTAPSPNWDSSSYPNAIGAVAEKTDTTSANVSIDVSGGVTVGTFNLGGSSGNAAFQAVLANSITFNQDGSGSGIATISNTNSGSGNAHLAIGSGTMTLADDLLISNTSNSGYTYAVNITSSIGSAAGTTTNLTVSNVSNTVPVTLGGANTFKGDVLIQKGLAAFTYSTGSSFGNSANKITVGETNGGSVSFISTGSNVNLSNSVTVAAGTGGTTLLGSSSGATSSNSTFSGLLTLNGDVTLTSSKGTGADTRYTGGITGGGNITISGSGLTKFGDDKGTMIANTYTGDTTLTGSSSLTLANNSSLEFVIGASGMNNRVSGDNNQTLNLLGDFSFDLTNAATSGSWTIVDVNSLNATFASTFTVLGGFVENNNVWTKTTGTSTYTFQESTGVLTATPEPAGLMLLAGLVGPLTFARRKRG